MLKLDRNILPIYDMTDSIPLYMDMTVIDILLADTLTKSEDMLLNQHIPSLKYALYFLEQAIFIRENKKKIGKKIRITEMKKQA